MKHALEKYNRIQDPEHLIPEDEPVFLLRAQDISAAATVAYWAMLNDALGGDPQRSILARKHAAKMAAWHKKKPAGRTGFQG